MTRRTLLSVLLIAAFSLVVAIPTLAVPGGHEDAKVDDERVIAAAKAAIAEKNKTEPVALTLVKIEKAQQQVVAGMNYTITLKVKAGSEVKEAEVVVWVKLDGKYQLTSWTWTKG